MQVINKFLNLFITSHEEIRGFQCEPMHIELKEGSRPIFQKLRRINKEHLPMLKEELNKFLKAGLICPIKHSNWANLVVIILKHTRGWRVCVDYKLLNAATKNNHYPLLFIDDIFDEVVGYESHSVCDGYLGYFQIAIAKEDQIKITFITPWGCFHYKVIPFGLKNSLL